MTKNHTFLATCNAAFTNLLCKELESYVGKKCKTVTSGVEFSCDTTMAIKLCMFSVYADEIYMYLKRINLDSRDSLETAVKSLRLRTCFVNTKSISVGVVSDDSTEKWRTKTASAFAKAIVSYFDGQGMTGLKVKQNDADLHIRAIFQDNTLRVAIRVSGDPAWTYRARRDTAAFDMRESTAAGIVTLSGCTDSTNFIDPSCSTPIMLLAAATLATRFPVGLSRKSFGFEHLAGFNMQDYTRIQTSAKKLATERINIAKTRKLVIRGYAESKSTVAELNSFFADHRLKDLISIEQTPLSRLSFPSLENQNRTIVVSTVSDKTSDVSCRVLNNRYSLLSQTLTSQFGGCRVGMVLPSERAFNNSDLMGELSRYIAVSVDLTTESRFCRLTVLELPARAAADTDSTATGSKSLKADQDKTNTTATAQSKANTTATAQSKTKAAADAKTAAQASSAKGAKAQETAASSAAVAAAAAGKTAAARTGAAADSRPDLTAAQAQSTAPTGKGTHASKSNKSAKAQADAGSSNAAAAAAAANASVKADKAASGKDKAATSSATAAAAAAPASKATSAATTASADKKADSAADSLNDGRADSNLSADSRATATATYLEAHDLELVLDDDVLESMAGELNCESANARDIISAITTLVNDLKNFQDFERGSLSALAQMLNAGTQQGREEQKLADDKDDEAEDEAENELLTALELLDSNNPISDEQFIACSRTLNSLLGRLMKRLPARFKRNIIRNITSRLHINEERSSAVFDVLTSMLQQLTVPDKFNPEIITNLVTLGGLTAAGSTAAPAAQAAAGAAGNAARAASAGGSVATRSAQPSKPQTAAEPVSSIPAAASTNGQKIIEKLCTELKCSRMWSINLVEQLHSLGREMSDAQNFDCASLRSFIQAVCLNDDMRRRWSSTAVEKLGLSNDRAKQFSIAVEELCVSAMSPDGLTINQVLALFNSMTRLPPEMMKQLADGMYGELDDLDESQEHQSGRLRTQCSALSQSLVRMAFAITRPDSFSLLDTFSEVAENEALRPLWPHLNLALPTQPEQPDQQDQQPSSLKESPGPDNDKAADPASWREQLHILRKNLQNSQDQDTDRQAQSAGDESAVHDQDQSATSIVAASSGISPDQSTAPSAAVPAAPEAAVAAESVAAPAAVAAPVAAGDDRSRKKSFDSLSICHESWAASAAGSGKSASNIAMPASVALQKHGFVDLAKSRILSSVLSAAAIMGMPVMLAGPGSGRIISAFCSASGFDGLSTITLGHQWDGAEFKAALNECSQAVRVDNVFSPGYNDSMLISVAESGRTVFIDYPFWDDIALQPKGLFNFVLPVLTDMYVDRVFIRDSTMLRAPSCPLGNFVLPDQPFTLPADFSMMGLSSSTLRNLELLLGIATELYRKLLPDNISRDQAGFNIMTAGALAPLARCTDNLDLLEQAYSSGFLFPAVKEMIEPVLKDSGLLPDDCVRGIYTAGTSDGTSEGTPDQASAPAAATSSVKSNEQQSASERLKAFKPGQSKTVNEQSGHDHMNSSMSRLLNRVNSRRGS